MKISVTFEIELPDYLPHTKKQVDDWMKFELRKRDYLNKSPIDRLDLFDMIDEVKEEATYIISKP